MRCSFLLRFDASEEQKAARAKVFCTLCSTRDEPEIVVLCQCVNLPNPCSSDRAMICAGRIGATGREGSENGADDRCLPTNSGVCAAGVASADRCTVSPAQPHQMAVFVARAGE